LPIHDYVTLVKKYNKNVIYSTAVYNNNVLKVSLNNKFKDYLT